jgi:ribonuclease D
VQSVLPDAALVEVAKRRPSNPRQLEQIRGLNPGQLRRRGEELLTAVQRGLERPPVPFEGERRPPPAASDAPLVALGEALVRSRALEAGLAYELIAARADLQAVVTSVRQGSAEPGVRTLEGWRRELVGAELLELLAGRRTLSVDGARRLHVSSA